MRACALETGRALRETSDALLRDLDVLAAIEEEKRTLAPDDARLVELAAQVQEIAHRILAGTAHQHELTQVAYAQAAAGLPEAPAAPIEATPRDIQSVLSEWREAERRHAAAEPGSAEALEAQALVARLRDEYRRAHEALSRGR